MGKSEQDVLDEIIDKEAIKEAMWEAEAAGKKMCGMCGWKAAEKGDWRCTESRAFPCPNGRKNLQDNPNWICPGFLAKPRKIKAVQAKPPRLKIPAGVHFLYFGRPRGGATSHQGVMTIAWTLHPGQNLRVGFAFTNMGDPKKGIKPEPFSKEQGRQEALKKLEDNFILVHYLYQPRRTVMEVSQALLDHDFERLFQFALIFPDNLARLIPSWTRDFAMRLKEQKRLRLFERRCFTESAPVPASFLSIITNTPRSGFLFNLLREYGRVAR